MDILNLSNALEVGGEMREINSDFRPCFRIMQLVESNEFTTDEKAQIIIGILYVDEIPDNLFLEAYTKAVKFLDMETDYEEVNNANGKQQMRLFSWEQDAKYIISAVNKSAEVSVRSQDFFHWWEFLIAMFESGDCVLNTLIQQRKLKKTGKQTKTDREWWAENKDMVELKIEKELTADEQHAKDIFDNLLKGGDSNG